MSSLASMPEEEVLDTSSHQSSFNSKNSKAESSTDSQKTRATARSKLMEEDKRIGNALKALPSEFDNTADLFPINTWNDNKAVFAAWRLLIANIDNCTGWLPESRSDMNLWLQSTREALYISSHSKNDLLHTILQ